MKRYGVVLLVVLLLSTQTACKRIGDYNEATSRDDASQVEARTFVMNTSIHSEVEQIVADKIELEISGDYEKLNELCHEKYSDAVIHRFIEHYDNGYGARHISIEYIKTYSRLEDLIEVEGNIPYGLANAFNAYDGSKVVFALYRYTNTDKSVFDQMIRLKNGLIGQYFVVSEIDDGLYLTYIQNVENF